MSESNGTLRARKPQLADSIEKLDQMVDDLSLAIPGAVADSLREALGAGFAAAIKDAVKAAVAEALKDFALRSPRSRPRPCRSRPSRGPGRWRGRR